MSEQQYGKLADRFARKYGVDPRLYRALIRQESGWNPNAVSGAGARGLTQVVPRWHPSANLSTPAGQLEYGAKHLGSLLKKYGNIRDALSVYNSGRPWKVAKSFSETSNYVAKILGSYGAGGGTAPRSGGPAPADPGGASSPPPGRLSAPQVDGRALMRMLAESRGGVMRGESPGRGFGAGLFGLVRGALANRKPVQVAPSGGGGGEAFPEEAGPINYGGAGWSVGGNPYAGTHTLGNWQSDLAHDFMGKAGDPVRIPLGGKVVKISGQPGGNPRFAGYGVTIQTPRGALFFKHLGSTPLKPGQRVKPGQLVGTLDGAVQGGAHLHLGAQNRPLLDYLRRLYAPK